MAYFIEIWNGAFLFIISSEFCYLIYKIWTACKDYKLSTDKLNSLNFQVHIECIQWYESHRTKLAKLNNWNSTYKKREDKTTKL